MVHPLDIQGRRELPGGCRVLRGEQGHPNEFVPRFREVEHLRGVVECAGHHTWDGLVREVDAREEAAQVRRGSRQTVKRGG